MLGHWYPLLMIGGEKIAPPPINPGTDDAAGYSPTRFDDSDEFIIEAAIALIFSGVLN